MNGNIIATLRHRLDMTQGEFARTLGVSQSTIAKVERGFLSVSSRIKTKIFQTFEVDESLLDLITKMKTFENGLKEEF